MTERSFWEKLEKPFFVLAPMADVTDYAFREVITKYGRPDVMWTEFVSADGLTHPEARKKLQEHIDAEYEKLSETARQRVGDYLVRVATTKPDLSETATFFLSLSAPQLRLLLFLIIFFIGF